MTLDPPGTIVVLGTTPIGIEAALYGRYLGYDVHLLAGADVWADRGQPSQRPGRIGPRFQNDWFSQFWLSEQTINERWDEPLPMMPARCLSPLAISAITAQRDNIESTLPITIGQWIEEGLQAVIETDLLRGRVFPNTFVDGIELVPVIAEDEADVEHEEGIPPDFLLSLRGESISNRDTDALRCECVIVADLPIDSIEIHFDLPVDYFFQFASAGLPDAAQEFRARWQQISQLYAELAGRADLDLYRPRRV